MIYTRLTIDTTAEAVDMVSYALGELGIEGIEVEDKLPLTQEEKEAMYIDILPEPKEAYDGLAKVSCYIPMADKAEEELCDEDKNQAFAANGIHNIAELIANIRSELDKLGDFMNVGAKTITVSQADDADWLHKWKEYFKPFWLEDNILIKPSWYHDPCGGRACTDNDIVIEMDPGIAFGTGAHDTTKLCIRQLKKYIVPGTTVLDVGCGSGILSIIAIKLGAGKALGVDIDEIAVRVSEENRTRNGILEEQFVVRQGDVIRDADFTASIGEQFDIVVANILADVIILLSAVVAPLMKDTGVFITSGIINTKEEEVRKALLDSQFEIVETEYMGDWVSFTARKRQ